MTVTAAKGVLLVGVILIIIHAFGVQFGPMDIGWLGVGVAFASFLGDHHHA